jgi:hypothetical protein
MVKTYKAFSDPNIPGRLVHMEDRNGNFMTFHYERIDPNNTLAGDEKYVLAYVVDTLGREVRYQYYARTSQTVGGRTMTIPHPAGKAYQWMPNHWHMVLMPREDGALSRLMYWVTMTHHHT